MKALKILAVLFMVLATTALYAQTLDVSWVPPTERADNTPLPLSEISAFRISYGVTTGIYLLQLDIADPNATSVSIPDLSGGTYYVVMSVLDLQGRESIFTPEASILLDTAPPKSVTGLTLTAGVLPTP